MIVSSQMDNCKYIVRNTQELETESIHENHHAIRYKNQINVDSNLDSVKKSNFDRAVSHEGNFLFHQLTQKAQPSIGFDNNDKEHTSEHNLESIIEENRKRHSGAGMMLRANSSKKKITPRVRKSLPVQDQGINASEKSSDKVDIRFDQVPLSGNESENHSERSFNLRQLSKRAISQGRKVIMP